MHKTFWVAAFVAVLGGGLTGCASGPKPPAASSLPAGSHPWDKAVGIANQSEADFNKSGTRGIAPHVPELEQALANAGPSFQAADAPTGPIYRLADGSAEALGVLLVASVGGPAGKGNREVIAVNNPYPVISYLLGYYYNDVGKPDQALRVLDAGLALPTAMDMGLGEHTPAMISERGAALAAMKRWPEALENYKKGASIGKLEKDKLALMQRGEGLALSELGRLDEAEKFYRDSLVNAPNNPVAMNELKYIAGLRSGGPTAPTGLVAPVPQKPDKT